MLWPKLGFTPSASNITGYPVPTAQRCIALKKVLHSTRLYYWPDFGYPPLKPCASNITGCPALYCIFAVLHYAPTAIRIALTLHWKHCNIVLSCIEQHFSTVGTSDWFKSQDGIKHASNFTGGPMNTGHTRSGRRPNYTGGDNSPPWNKSLSTRRLLEARQGFEFQIGRAESGVKALQWSWLTLSITGWWASWEASGWQQE